MKGIITGIIIAGVLIGVAFVFSSSKNNQPVSNVVDRTGNQENNVSIVDQKQIIEINARGGYQPQKSTARAGVPTVIRFNTDGTFDCSASVRIPSMNISKILPQTGQTDIGIGVQKEGVFRGVCGMGMYSFEIEFVK